MRCGLVLDQILGNEVMSYNTSTNVNHAEKLQINSEIQHICSLLGIFNSHMLYKMSSKYEEAYLKRTDLAKTQKKKELAMAFSIYKTLEDEGVPRPPENIVCLFNDVNPKSLLHISEKLAPIPKKGQKRKKIQKQFLLPEHLLLSQNYESADYVQTICDHLVLSFQFSKVVLKWVESIQDVFYGHKHTDIVCAVILILLRNPNLQLQEGMKTVQNLNHDISQNDVKYCGSSTFNRIEEVVDEIMLFKHFAKKPKKKRITKNINDVE